MANNRKARTGQLKSKGVLGKLKKLFSSDMPKKTEEGKPCKDRTAAHKRPADWKETKKGKRRAYKKARRAGRR